MKSQPCGPRMRGQLAVGLATTLVAMTAGCHHSEPTKPRPEAYECSAAGQQDAHTLAVALGAPSPTAKIFNHCRSRWQTAGVRISPFLVHGTIDEAESAAAKLWECGTPQHPPNMLPSSAATLGCTIADIRAEVSLVDEGRDVSANIYPRE